MLPCAAFERRGATPSPPRAPAPTLPVTGARPRAAGRRRRPTSCLPLQVWAETILQDSLLVLCTAALSLVLLVDAFARENAYQLLGCLGMGALQASQLAVFLVNLFFLLVQQNAECGPGLQVLLKAVRGAPSKQHAPRCPPAPLQATLHGRSDDGAAAAVAICLCLLAGALALARPAYLSFGWRMYSRIASAWRLKHADKERVRAAALARQRFAALAKLDAALLVLLLVVAAVNAANPAAGGGQQPQPLGLLVGATAAAGPLLAAWLAACRWAVLPRLRPWAKWADLAFPLCYVPPLLLIFTGECGLFCLQQCRACCMPSCQHCQAPPSPPPCTLPCAQRPPRAASWRSRTARLT